MTGFAPPAASKTFGDDNGSRLKNRIAHRPYRRTALRVVPSRAKVELKPRSSVDPSFFRIYRVDQGADIVKSIPAGIDRVPSYQLRVTMSELRELFDGTEQVAGIAVVPWYVRQVFLP